MQQIDDEMFETMMANQKAETALHRKLTRAVVGFPPEVAINALVRVVHAIQNQFKSQAQAAPGGGDAGGDDPQGG